jgi:hypothetical protein
MKENFIIETREYQLINLKNVSNPLSNVFSGKVIVTLLVKVFYKF